MSDNIELFEFVELLEEWHKNKIEQLKLISESKPDTKLILGKIEIDGKSEMAKGIRTGVEIALSELGELPFSVSKKGEDNG